ncbi:MAG: hypothetical protein ABI867_37595 [Kofleriaceae bacterium]
MITDFHVEPVAGSFDVRAIEARLAELRFAVRDDQMSNRFMLVDDAASARRAIEKQRIGAAFAAAMVLVNDHRITVAHRGDGRVALRALLTGLAADQPVRYLDESFRDITASVGGELDVLLGAAP